MFNKEELIQGLQDLIDVCEDLYPDRLAIISGLSRLKSILISISDSKIPVLSILFGGLVWWIKFKDIKIWDQIVGIISPLSGKGEKEKDDIRSNSAKLIVLSKDVEPTSKMN